MIRGILYIIVICIQFRFRIDSKIMKHKFLELDQESQFNMSKGSREKDIENLFPIVTKSSIFFLLFVLYRRD